MKATLQKKGIPIPSFLVINNAMDVIHFISKTGYPVILKPRTSKRARGISILRNESDLYHSLFNGLKRTSEDLINVMIEEFVNGPMYHIDGVVINKEIRFIWPSLYLSNCMGFPDGNYISSCLLSPDDDLFEKLNQYVTTCISALPSPENFAFHAEVFLCEDGSLKRCEIAARAAGGPVMTLVETVFGINPKEMAFKAYLCNEPAVNFPIINTSPDLLCGWIIIPNKLSHSYISGLPKSCPFHQVTSYQTFAENGDFFSAERRVIAEITVCAETSDEIKRCISDIMEWFYSHTEWQSE